MTFTLKTGIRATPDPLGGGLFGAREFCGVGVNQLVFDGAGGSTPVDYVVSASDDRFARQVCSRMCALF
jgi:hypothetical protein